MPTSSAQPSRPLAAHEKHFLSRSRKGLPTIVALGTAYCSSTQAPTRAFLAGRIGELQAHFPTLYAQFGYGRGDMVATREEGPWSATMIIQDDQYSADSDTEGDVFTKLLLDEGNRMSRNVSSRDDGPLWRVGVHTHPLRPRVYITLTLDHVLADGHGVLNLLQALLAPSIADLPYERVEDIPSFEDTVDVAPPAAADRQGEPPSPYIWPSVPPKIMLSQATPSASIFSLSVEDLSLLKAAAKAHGVPTLHPVLKTIYSFALWSVYRLDSPSLRLASSTPRSERNLALGHAYCTGNYVCAHKFDISIYEGQNFWYVARRVLEQIADPVDLARARAASGPQPPPQPKPLGIPAPFTQSFSFSNLGLSSLPSGADDMSWLVVPTENGKGPLSVMVIGFERGLRVCTTWRDGGAVEIKEVKEVERIFMRVVRRLIEGKDLADELIE
ncbi:hypothetical protein I350_02141 [Cryptococcus amylolentus CBS 6273]|uniref:Alcohol acetyltransferase n=1 Tax=Cryptococcus amylolentus CBS 6273 TaxID=1296118 RepID=A0A1E3K9Q2_9TREE|nr:hypothetical protein I350_02141 [Cryptococcus amylolentus CBS 6273]